jgi:hypothetical protein
MYPMTQQFQFFPRSLWWEYTRDAYIFISALHFGISNCQKESRLIDYGLYVRWNTITWYENESPTFTYINTEDPAKYFKM